ncbi:hypothetical protein [Streptomyces sp. NPDC093225]|uniref:hypothetical protein n=1 Tax=Streptomyces sp. NPDC093225 TaxID=3366034 RepID=UPI0037F1B586
MRQTTSRGSRSRRPLAILLALAFPAAALTTFSPAAAADTTTESTAEAEQQVTSASEAEAFTLAAKAGHRIEIVDRREEYAETFANPDGSMTRRQYADPVWTRADLTWRRTDPQVERREDGTLGPKAATFGISFSTGGTAPLVTMKRDGKSLALTWPAPLPEPVVEGNTALYKSVLPDVDLKLTADVDGFAEHLIVKTPQAAANPALKTIKLGIESHGVTLDDTPGDVLLAKDAQGNVVFKAPQPKMWEQPPAAADAPNPSPATTDNKAVGGATPARSTQSTLSNAAMPVADAPETEGGASKAESAPVAADVTGSTLTLTPDAGLLASADQFPLVIDPVFTGGGTDGWYVVYSDTPNDAYPNGIGWHSDNPADEPRVGYNGSGDTSSFFAMDTTGLYGATITDVTFAVELTHTWGCDASAAGPTELWSAKKLDPMPTWNNQDNYWGSKLDADSFADFNKYFCPDTPGHDFKSAALTAYVQEAADKGWDPLVLGMRTPLSYRGNVNSYKRFRNHPALEITYNFKPEVLDADAFEGTWTPGGDGNKLVPCGGSIGNSGLAMTARLRDRDGGTVTSEFVVTDSSGKAVPVSYGSKTVASGQTATATVHAQDLVNGTYKWKVRATDGEGPASAYTSDCSFTVDRIGPKYGVDVWTEAGDPIPDGARFQARTPVRLKLHNQAGDLAGFCWAMDHSISVSSTRCSNGNWVPVGSSGYTATIDVMPVGYPNSILYVLAYDQAGNHSPTDGAADTTILSTTKAEVVYEPGETPNTANYKHDRLGDLDGDGYGDALATDTSGRLRLYGGDGTGKVAPAVFVGTAGWSGALIAHGGDFTNLTDPGLSVDGYEDVIARLSDNNIYLYPGNGRGEPRYSTRRVLNPPSSSGNVGGWKSVRQMILPGDIDERADSGYAKGNDLVTVQCTDDACTDGDLYLYPGKTRADFTPNQTAPFDLGDGARRIGNGSRWLTRTILAVGDQNGDGIKDILARDEIDHDLILFPGEKSPSGVWSIDFDAKTVYGNGGWHAASRPLLTSAGNIQGTVKAFTETVAGVPTPYKRFVPTPGESAGDLWATTSADPDAVVPYVKSDGSTASTTCPTGCLLFYPGGTTTHRSPQLVGTGSWSTAITGLF